MEESVGEEASIPGVRIWGPVPGAQAVGAGALAAASSVLIAPQVAPARLYQRLTALVPDEVLPKVSDTAGTLRLRLLFVCLPGSLAELRMLAGNKP